MKTLQKTILITGINGYLGSKLAGLFSSDYNIIGLEYGLDNLFRIKDKDYKLYSSRKGISDQIFEENQIDIVIHAATFYGRNNESNLQMLHANVTTPIELLHKACYHSCELFVNTDTVLDRFTSSYALTKRQFNDWCQFYASNQQIKLVNLKLEHFYGPGTSDTNFITSMVRKMIQNEPVIPLTKGEQNRDFLHVTDLLSVYQLVLDQYIDFSVYECFNVGHGVNTNLRFLLEELHRLTKSSSKLDFGAVAYRKNELMESNNDLSKLLNLGWKPKVDITKGLLDVVLYEKNKLK